MKNLKLLLVIQALLLITTSIGCDNDGNGKTSCVALLATCFWQVLHDCESVLFALDHAASIMQLYLISSCA